MRLLTGKASRSVRGANNYLLNRQPLMLPPPGSLWPAPFQRRCLLLSVLQAESPLTRPPPVGLKRFLPQEVPSTAGLHADAPLLARVLDGTSAPFIRRFQCTGFPPWPGLHTLHAGNTCGASSPERPQPHGPPGGAACQRGLFPRGLSRGSGSGGVHLASGPKAPWTSPHRARGWLPRGFSV